VVAAMYGASRVSVKTGKGEQITIEESTHYPFEDEIQFRIKCENTCRFPLYLRIPAWCSDASVRVNGKEQIGQIKGGQYVIINRKWSNNDHVTLTLPMEFNITTWDKNSNSFSVAYGPLTYSLKIDQKIIRKDSKETAIGDSKWQEGADAGEWPSWEIHPASDWNYTLVIDKENPASSLTFEQKPWPESNFPFTPEDVPFVIKARGKKIPEWTLDQYKLVGELKDLPKTTGEKIEEIELIPMGAARIRITAFPQK